MSGGALQVRCCGRQACLCTLLLSQRWRNLVSGVPGKRDVWCPGAHCMGRPAGAALPGPRCWLRFPRFSIACKMLQEGEPGEESDHLARARGAAAVRQVLRDLCLNVVLKAIKNKRFSKVGMYISEIIFL